MVTKFLQGSYRKLQLSLRDFLKTKSVFKDPCQKCNFTVQVIIEISIYICTFQIDRFLRLHLYINCFALFKVRYVSKWPSFSLPRNLSIHWQLFLNPPQNRASKRVQKKRKNYVAFSAPPHPIRLRHLHFLYSIKYNRIKHSNRILKKINNDYYHSPEK